MYAVIMTGGKQYRVKAGASLKVAKLALAVGDTVAIDKVLMAGEGDTVEIGAPYLNNVTVSATVVSHGRHDKVKIIKFRRRKHHLKRQGHRQDYTEIKITDIQK
ncbi:MAG: ribosomal protein [Pseudomonadota bacterium]|jgi:large subunit ribosomal protein L21